ncbi:MAG: PilZ domain-containing protein, partial [Candidatus Eremiobacterota bacterium]
MIQRFLDGLRQIVLGPRQHGAEETRTRTRVLCRYPVLYTTEDGDTQRAYVVDIGVNGMRLEGVKKLKKSSRIQVASAYPGLEQNKLRCEVVWCRERMAGDYNAGIRYDEKDDNLRGSWVKVILQELGLGDETAFQRRKHVRIATSLRAEIRDLRSGHYLTDGRVLNLSIGGCLVQSDNPVTDNLQVLCLIGPYANYPVLSISAKCL